MDLRTATQQKLDAIIRVVEALRTRDYPQKDARPVADEILATLSDQRAQLIALPQNISVDVLENLCQAVSQVLGDLLPVLGFLQRSQHAANPFEVYEPLLRMVSALFPGANMRLVLSSEWELSPYTIPMSAIATLPDVVLIGLPASESSNVLLIPLAGHEMGHSLWVTERGAQQYDLAVGAKLFEAINNRFAEFKLHFQHSGTINDLFTTATGMARVQPLAQFALQQCEEVFCDFLGLRLFGESFLRAMSYMLAPSWPGERPIKYPSERQRAEYLIQVASSAGISTPADFVKRFVDRTPPTGTKRALTFDIVDATTASLIGSLWTHVDSVVTSAKLSLPTDQEVDAIVEELTRVVPASAPGSLPSIILAGWRVMLLSDRWKEYPQIADHRWQLNELLLKSAQVLEIRTHLGLLP